MPVAPPSPTGARQNEVQRIESFIHDRLLAKYGEAAATKYATSYARYADSHPRQTAQQAYVAWFFITGKLNQKIAKDIGLELKGLGGLEGATVSALPDVFKGLSLGNLMLRVGEILVGVVLLAVGISAMAKGTEAGQAAAKVAKIIPKV